MGRLLDDLRESGDVPFDGTSSDGSKESGFVVPSYPSLNVDIGVGATPAVAACVPQEAPQAIQQTASDVPPVNATPKKLVIYGKTAASRKWVVDECTGQPTCFRNNEKEWTDPETVPLPWFRRGASTFFDKDTGEHRALTYDDMRNDLKGLKSRAGAEKPLRFTTFAAVNLAHSDNGIAKRLHKDKDQHANAHLATGMVLCGNYPAGCGFCVQFSTVNGSQVIGAASFRNTFDVNGVKHTHEWRLNLAHNCNCMNQPSIVMLNPPATAKPVMSSFTSEQLADIDALAGANFDNDFLYTQMSQKYPTVTWSRDWFGKQLSAARKRHVANSGSANSQLLAARDHIQGSGGRCDIGFDTHGRVTSVFLQTLMMKKAAEAYGGPGGVFQIDASQLDDFSEYSIMQTVVKCALAKTLVTSALISFGGETKLNAQTAITSAGHTKANGHFDLGGAFKGLQEEGFIEKASHCTWHALKLAPPNLAPPKGDESEGKATLHLPGESKQINDSFKERVEKLVYTTHEWRAEATPLVERDFTNLMLDFPQPGAKKFLEALYHNRHTVLVFYVQHNVKDKCATTHSDGGFDTRGG
jgi:hypothetical protein